MRARPTAVGCLLAAVVATTACERGTVAVAPEPEVGDRARYEYVIDVHITTALDGREPTVNRIDTTLVVDQEITAVSDDRVEADVVLRRDRRPPQSTSVVLDPTGTIRDLDLAEGLGLEDLNLSQLGALVLPQLVPPARELAPGERWPIEAGPLVGHGRLARLGVEDGNDVAEVHIEVRQPIDEVVTSGASVAELRGDTTARATAAYELDGGTLRRSSMHSSGEVRAAIQPPTGLDAPPALGTISYEINVRATRLR